MVLRDSRERALIEKQVEENSSLIHIITHHNFRFFLLERSKKEIDSSEKRKRLEKTSDLHRHRPLITWTRRLAYLQTTPAPPTSFLVLVRDYQLLTRNGSLIKPPFSLPINFARAVLSPFRPDPPLKTDDKQTRTID